MLRAGRGARAADAEATAPLAGVDGPAALDTCEPEASPPCASLRFFEMRSLRASSLAVSTGLFWLPDGEPKASKRLTENILDGIRALQRGLFADDGDVAS